MDGSTCDMKGKVVPKVLPNFIVIGAMKAGTTTLYDYLSRHKEIGMSRMKETDFFVASKNWERGLDWYSSQFSTKTRCNGEVSPNYSKRGVFPGVPERLARIIPECRIIFLARDPVKRAESQYRHAILSGERLPKPEALQGSHALRHVIDTSCYTSQMEPYLEQFPLQSFLFLDFEDLVEDPLPSLTRVAHFLEIADDWPVHTGIAANTSEEVSRLPLWLFRARESRLGARLKTGLPPSALRRMKTALRTRNPRQAPPLDPGFRAMITAAVAEDAQRFRALTGLPFLRWSV